MMIQATQLYKSYQAREVLRGIDLEIQKGEIVSIVGASGAGKSTLLHLLGTLDTPDKGSVQIDGVDVWGLKSRKLAKFRNERIGFVFQFHNLLPEFNALENVCLPAWIAQKPKKEVETRAMSLLERLGVNHIAQQTPAQLSGGEQQRVAIARALINAPAVVLADEPSGNLDERNSEELHRLFIELREEFGQTFVIVTHDKQLAAMADRTLEIKAGQLLPATPSPA